MKLPVFALCWAPAHADTISYTDSGTFTTTTASSAFTGPSAAWTFAFQADSHPAVSDFGMGGFSFAFSNFSYFLNGSPVAITPTFIRFFSPTNGGGFEICFSGTTPVSCADGLGTPFFGPAMYAGTTSAPTLLTGAFTESFAVAVDPAAYSQPDTTVQANVVPEPSTLLTLAAGLLALGGDVDVGADSEFVRVSLVRASTHLSSSGHQSGAPPNRAHLSDNALSGHEERVFQARGDAIGRRGFSRRAVGIRSEGFGY